MSPPAPPTPSRAELRKLVLNYLAHYCFVDTAIAFSHTVPLQGWYDGEGEGGEAPEQVRLTDLQITQLETRKGIREQILGGHIPAARTLITGSFPLVLSDDPPPPAAPTVIPAPPPPIIPSTPLTPAYPSSLSPPHISLALSIQHWIEIIRTVPLRYPPLSPAARAYRARERLHERTRARSPTSPPLSPSGSPAPMPVPQDQPALISTGRTLYARARALPPPHNEAFREELVGIAGLMAYREPERAPESVRHHLEWSRREGVATQVNGAILNSLGHPPYAPLASLLRQLTFIYQMLHELGVRPPAAGYPDGVEILHDPVADEGDGEGVGDGEGEGDWATRAIPEFRIGGYLYRGRTGRGDVVEAEGEGDEGADAETTAEGGTQLGSGSGTGDGEEVEEDEDEDEDMDAEGEVEGGQAETPGGGVVEGGEGSEDAEGEGEGEGEGGEEGEGMEVEP